jgi:hypothetical protein
LHPPQEGAVERDPDEEYVQKGGYEPSQEDYEVVRLIPGDLSEGFSVSSVDVACL